MKLRWHNAHGVAIEVVSEGGTCGLLRCRSLRLKCIGRGISSLSGFKNHPHHYQKCDNRSQNPQYPFHCDPPFNELSEESFASGRETRNVLPWPSSLFRVMSPPCTSTAQRVIDRPRPAPPHSRVRALSTR